MQNKEVTNKQIVTALLIGDGTLQWRPQSGHYSIKTISSKVIYEDYHMWKHQLMVNIFGDKVRICEDKRDRSLLHSWVSGKSIVEPYYKFLYKNVNGFNKKRISSFLQRLNHPLCLAIWLMDDGSCSGNKSKRMSGESYYKSYGLYLATNQFDYSDHELMVSWFKKEFDLEPKIYKQIYSNKNHLAYGRVEYRLYFNSKQARKLWSLVEPYISPIESMRYKFRFAYLIDTVGIKQLPSDFDIKDYS